MTHVIAYLAGVATAILAVTHGPRLIGRLLATPGDLDWRRR